MSCGRRGARRVRIEDALATLQWASGGCSKRHNKALKGVLESDSYPRLLLTKDRRVWAALQAVMSLACRRALSVELMRKPHSPRGGKPGSRFDKSLVSLAVLQDIAAKAPNARIAVPLYPSMLRRQGLDIPVGGKEILVNDTKVGANDLTVAGSIEKFVSRLNGTIKAAVEEAAGKKVNVQTVVGTYNAFVNGGHRFGDVKAPWATGILLGLNWRESFHPNTCGHQALAALVYEDIEPHGAPPAKCP